MVSTRQAVHSPRRMVSNPNSRNQPRSDGRIWRTIDPLLRDSEVGSEGSHGGCPEGAKADPASVAPAVTGPRRFSVQAPNAMGPMFSPVRPTSQQTAGRCFRQRSRPGPPAQHHSQTCGHPRLHNSVQQGREQPSEQGLAAGPPCCAGWPDRPVGHAGRLGHVATGARLAYTRSEKGHFAQAS